jgi:phosphoenolpyruvate carboxykinase (ATP)
MDKYIVEQSPSKNNIWWGQVNRPMKPETFDKLYKKVVSSRKFTFSLFSFVFIAFYRYFFR